MTTTDESAPKVRELPHLEYEGDPLHSLRVPELRVANATLSRTLGRGVDVLHACMEPTEDRWDAMAHIAWIIAKRSDPQALLGVWTNATAAEISKALSIRGNPVPPPADGQDDDAAPPADLEDLADTAEQEGPTGTTG